MKTLIAALIVTAGMNANADVFRPWGDVNGDQPYTVDHDARRAEVGFQPWTDRNRAAEPYSNDPQVAAQFRKGIGFQPFSRA